MENWFSEDFLKRLFVVVDKVKGGNCWDVVDDENSLEDDDKLDFFRKILFNILLQHSSSAGISS